MEQFIEQAKKDRYPVVSINKAAAALKDNPRVNYEMFIQEVKSQKIDGDEVGRYITELCMDCGMSDPNFKEHIEAVCGELCNQIEVAAKSGLRDDLRKIASYYKDDIESLATARAHKEYDRLQSFEAGVKRINDCAMETKFSHKHEEALVDAYVQNCFKMIEQVKQKGEECPAFIVNMSNAQFEQNMIAYAEQLKGGNNEIARSMRERDLYAEFEAIGNPRSALEAALERKYSCDWIKADDYAQVAYDMADKDVVKEYCDNAYFYALKHIDTDVDAAVVERVKQMWKGSKLVRGLRLDYIQKTAANCEEEDIDKHVDVIINHLPQTTRERNAEMREYLEFRALSYWMGVQIMAPVQAAAKRAGVKLEKSRDVLTIEADACCVDDVVDSETDAEAQRITDEMYSPEEALNFVVKVEAARELNEPTVVAAMDASLRECAKLAEGAVQELNAKAEERGKKGQQASATSSKGNAQTSIETSNAEQSGNANTVQKVEDDEEDVFGLGVFKLVDKCLKTSAWLTGEAAVMQNLFRLMRRGVLSQKDFIALQKKFKEDPVAAKMLAEQKIAHAKEMEADEKREKARRKRNVANPKLGLSDKDVDYYTQDGLRKYGSGHRTSPWGKLAPVLIGLVAIIVLLVKGRITGGLYILPILGVVLAVAGFLMRPEAGRTGGKPIWLLMVIGGVLLAFMTL